MSGITLSFCEKELCTLYREEFQWRRLLTAWQEFCLRIFIAIYVRFGDEIDEMVCI